MECPEALDAFFAATVISNFPFSIEARRRARTWIMNVFLLAAKTLNLSLVGRCINGKNWMRTKKKSAQKYCRTVTFAESAQWEMRKLVKSRWCDKQQCSVANSARNANIDPNDSTALCCCSFSLLPNRTDSRAEFMYASESPLRIVVRFSPENTHSIRHFLCGFIHTPSASAHSTHSLWPLAGQTASETVVWRISLAKLSSIWSEFRNAPQSHHNPISSIKFNASN